MAEASTKFKKGTRVVATDALRGVPEGTPGNVRIPVGLTWLRYRVQFDNGIDIGSVSHSKLVAEGNWEHFKANRSQVAAEAAAKAAAAKQVAKNAVEKPEAPAAAEGNDRLAAMLAKSKAARAAKS